MKGKKVLALLSFLASMSLFVACGALSGGSESSDASQVSNDSTASVEQEHTHEYDNACDDTCNTCEATRETEHTYDNACDVDCDVCGEERSAAHEYDNACDVECNICGEARVPGEHDYDNACDADCNDCGATREVGAHVYDNACDVDCNECGEIREVGAHVYDDNKDESCNECGEIRELPLTGEEDVATVLWNSATKVETIGKDPNEHWANSMATSVVDNTAIPQGYNGTATSFFKMENMQGAFLYFNAEKPVWYYEALKGKGYKVAFDFYIETDVGAVNVGGKQWVPNTWLTRGDGSNILSEGEMADGNVVLLDTLLENPETVLINVWGAEGASYLTFYVGNFRIIEAEKAPDELPPLTGEEDISTVVWNSASFTQTVGRADGSWGGTQVTVVDNTAIPEGYTGDATSFFQLTGSVGDLLYITSEYGVDYYAALKGKGYLVQFDFYMKTDGVYVNAAGKQVHANTWLTRGDGSNILREGEMNDGNLITLDALLDNPQTVLFDIWAVAEGTYLEIYIGNFRIVESTVHIHSYDNACDVDCNGCGDIREVGDHVYDNACDVDCNECGDIREVGEHDYENACDVDCDECGATREVGDHVYDNACDVDCNECGDEREVSDHVYDNACDEDCNECGDVREAGVHFYDDACDPDCNECGDIREVGMHEYDNACDADCNVCGDSREVSGHVYDNACDEDCNECGDEREVNGHAYDNACDEDCNECGAIREVGGHVYDGERDADCNECGETRDLPLLGDEDPAIIVWNSATNVETIGKADSSWGSTQVAVVNNTQIPSGYTGEATSFFKLTGSIGDAIYFTSDKGVEYYQVLKGKGYLVAFDIYVSTDVGVNFGGKGWKTNTWLTRGDGSNILNEGDMPDGNLVTLDALLDNPQTVMFDVWGAGGNTYFEIYVGNFRIINPNAGAETPEEPTETTWTWATVTADKAGARYVCNGNDRDWAGTVEYVTEAGGKTGAFYKVTTIEEGTYMQCNGIAVAAVHEKAYYEQLLTLDPNAEFTFSFYYVDGAGAGVLTVNGTYNIGLANHTPQQWHTISISLAKLVENYDNLINGAGEGMKGALIGIEGASSSVTFYVGDFAINTTASAPTEQPKEEPAVDAFVWNTVNANVTGAKYVCNGNGRDWAGTVEYVTEAGGKTGAFYKVTTIEEGTYMQCNGIAVAAVNEKAYYEQLLTLDPNATFSFSFYYEDGADAGVLTVNGTYNIGLANHAPKTWHTISISLATLVENYDNLINGAGEGMKGALIGIEGASSSVTFYVGDFTINTTATK